MRRFLFLSMVFLLSVSVSAQKGAKKAAPATADQRLAGIDTLVNRLLKEWHAPGVGIVVVEKDKVFLASGFGYKDYENKQPVTANTLFAIGSCSKAFTSSLLGMLQGEGKLDFDKPVTEYLPGFKFYNEELTQNVTVRDLTCHRTGLPRHDLSWYLNPTTRDSSVMRIQYMEPSTPWRQAWQYNNWMFLLQGVIAEKLYGKSWEELVASKIFGPLGMKTSNFAPWKGSYADLAKGYRTDDKDAIHPMDYYRIEGMGPAGAIYSSPAEMAAWVTTWIYGGKYQGKEVLPESYVRQAMSSQMVINAGLPSPENPDAFFANYGMGWMLASYRGHYRVEHGGNIDGFSASTAFYPTDSIGIVVLVNQNGSPLPGMIRNYISDRMLKLPYRDWHAQIKTARDKARTAAAGQNQADSLARKKDTQPSHALKDYAGLFEHPGYGALRLATAQDSLFLHSSHVTFWLEHYHYDIFRPIDLSEADAIGEDNPFRLRFQTNAKGEIDAFIFQGLQDGVKDIVFKRQAEAVAMAQNELEKYLGEYDLGGVLAKAYLRGETLMVLVPGQPDYEMVPLGNHEFKFKVLEGFSVRFDIGPDGKASAVTFIQPNGNFRAVKK
ncbi:MAG: serine hydrolase [Haliscomenobacter sp.]|nr:serine hydrolase [Haliscomenobacter sp.]